MLISWPWATSKLSFGHETAQPFGRLVDRLDAIVEEEGLPAALVLALQRKADEFLVVLADEGLDRPAALWWGFNHADVAHPCQRHLQGPWDRRRAHRDDIDLQLHLPQKLFLLDAETLLLVDDEQPEVVGPHVAAQQPVCADQNVGLALIEVGHRGALLSGASQATDDINGEWKISKPLAEGSEVLLGEDRCRRQHEHLLAPSPAALNAARSATSVLP